jgi:sterol desaturase/sphingolipid hydroxylase (fatty acid hydroxylase superfamily)
MSKLGLQLFSPSDPPEYRRMRLIFLAVYGIAVGAVIFPWPKVWGIYPIILGLPFLMVWMVLAIVTIFLGLFFLFRSEPKGE